MRPGPRAGSTSHARKAQDRARVVIRSDCEALRSQRVTPTRHVAQLLALLLCCGGSAPSVRLAAQDTVPAGFGTLKRDEIVVRFATEQFDEQVIGLLAPDTYRSLAQLLTTKQREIAPGGSLPDTSIPVDKASAATAVRATTVA